MASPPSPSSSVGSQNFEGNLPTLEQLVNHFVVSKRSLASTSYVWRANEIVNSARVLLEENAVLSAKNAFVRRSIAEQVDSLEALQRGVELVGAQSDAEFKSLLQTLDDSSARLNEALSALRSTPVDPSLQPSAAADTTEPPQRCLYDHVDSSHVTTLNDSMRACIDRVNAFTGDLDAATAAFASSLRDLREMISSIPHPADDYTSGSPLPMHFRDLEAHATETATCLQSLVRHYDLCVTALKHTEGGGEAANRATISDMADVGMQLETLDPDAPPQPMTEEDRRDMLAVLEKDAAEVEDVTAEIRERSEEMERLLQAMEEYVAALQRERDGLNNVLGALAQMGQRTKGLLGQVGAYTRSWAAERRNIEHGVQELEGLKEFFEDFLDAYWALILEVERRRKVREKTKQVARDAQRQLDELFEEEVRAREGFTARQGNFLPSDIWPGLADPVMRYDVRPVVGAGLAADDAAEVDTKRSIPELPREVLDLAIRRMRPSL